MADEANRLREARRRRILENSEKRMQRILGGSNAAPEDSPSAPGRKVTFQQASETESLISGDGGSKSDCRPRFQSAAQPADPVPSLGGGLANPFGPMGGLSDLDGTAEQLQTPHPVALLMLTAVTSIALLSNGHGSLIGHNALVPFAVYQICFYFITRNEVRRKPSSLISTVLTLSGLPPEKLSKLTGGVQRLQALFQDLCVYVFVCVMSFKVFDMMA